MAPTLYMIPPSPPVRAVLITAKAIGLELDLKPVNIAKGEHMTPDYLKINPQHTVPSLVDGSLTVWDSHAISTYLVSRYAKNDALYPKDLKKRAIIDQRLHFDSGVAFPTGGAIIGAILRKGKTTITEEDIQSLSGVYAFLEAFLEGKIWMAGDFLSLADYHLFTVTTSANVIAPIDDQKFPRLAAWLKKVEALPEAEANKEGLAMFEQMIKSRLTS